MDIRLRTELPEFRRCCFCIPLRYGLIAWMYIKSIFAVLTIIFLGLFVSWLIDIKNRDYMSDMSAYLTRYMVLHVILIVYLILKVLFSILFLIGGHMKNVAMLNIYFYYSLVGLGIFCLICLAFCGNSIAYYIVDHSFFIHHVISILFDIAMFVAMVGIQGYIILLTRSEIKKLNSKHGLRFFNNALEAERVEVIAQDQENLDHEEITEEDTWR